MKDRIAAIQNGWSGLFTQLIAEAQALGKLRADEDPLELAFELNAYLLMGNTGFVLHDDPAYLSRRRRLEQQLELLKTCGNGTCRTREE